MRSRTGEGLPGRCPRCWVRQPGCVCPEPLDLGTEVWIVRHVKERWKTTNTGRLAALALRRAALVEFGDLAAPLDPSTLAPPGTWLLWPGTGAPTGPPPRRLLVLDGTWAQARQMRKRIAVLRDLPCLSLAGPVAGGPRLREAPYPEARTTLEAIAGALGRLEGPAVEANLLELQRRHVEAVLRGRGAAAG